MFQLLSDFNRAFGAPDFHHVFRDFDRAFAPTRAPTRAQGDTLFVPRDRRWSVPSDDYRVSENDEGYTITAELPGVSEKDVEVKAHDGVLTIKAAPQTRVPEGYVAKRQEAGDWEFSHSFTLPRQVDADRIDAQLANGILHVTLNKSAAAKPRQIAVKSG